MSEPATASSQLHLAQNFLPAESVLDVQEAQLGFQVGGFRHGPGVEAALGHCGVVVTVQDHDYVLEVRGPGSGME